VSGFVQQFGKGKHFMKKQTFLGIFGLTVFVSLVMAGICLAAVPGEINYQGVLTDAAGAPLDGTYTMAFGIYDEETFGTLEWSESHADVTVNNGVYNVLLGSINAMDSSVFNGSDRWLEVAVEGETMSPRQPFSATAYALKAADADALETNTIKDLDARYVLEGESGAVHSNMIADGAINATDLATNSVTSAEIAAGAVGTSEISDNSVTAEDLAVDSVGHSEIASNAIREDEIRWSINHAAADLNGGIMALTNSSDATAGNFPMGVAGQATGAPTSSNPVMGVFGGAPGLGQGGPLGSFPGTKIGVGGASDTGPGVAGVSSSGYGVYAYSNLSYGLYAKSDGGSSYGVYAYSPNYIGVYGYGGNYGLYGYATEQYSYGVRGYAIGANGYGGYFTASNTNGIGIYAFGGSSGYAAVFRGNVVIRDRISNDTVMELGAGLDYAEGFNVAGVQKPTPGSVLIIDPENPGKLTLSTRAYDTKVAGIVAGADNLGSGVRLGGDRFDNDVALAGRVYCNADATQSEIRTGDLLTTSDQPGYAMKVEDYTRAQGAILGKAMQDMAQGEQGKILVLVTLQ
jgi:hypothetical protein